MSRIWIAGLVAMAAVMPGGVRAEEPVTVAGQEAGLLEIRANEVAAVLRKETPAAQVFAPGFIAAVPENQLHTLFAQLVAQFGAFEGIGSIIPRGPTSGIIAFRFERAIVSGPISILADGAGLVDGLLLNSITPIGDSPAAIAADLARLPGRVSAYFAPIEAEGLAILAVNEQDQFAIGSAFKLYVLSALAHSIAAGEHRWDEVVRLDRRSLPSGMMQDWPDQAPMTLHTLATMMISISDNTATDMLIALLGRERIEAELRTSGHGDPARNLPLLNTLELFALKGSEPMRTAYLATDEPGKRRMLAEFEARVHGDPEAIDPPRFDQPTAIDSVEWFASAKDLDGIMRRLVEIEDPTARAILATSPAMPPAVRDQWDYIGYKGGSEPGVLNLTWLLRDKHGKWFVLSLGWNDPSAPLDANQLELIAQRMIALPRE